nr:hypothetical protein [Tanacetum cinerariifolium]
MASAVICLSKGQRFNFFKYIFDSLVRNVDSSSKFYMYPRFIQLIIQTNIADLSTHNTRYISPALTQKVFANIRRVGKAAQQLEIVKLKARVKKLEKINKVKSSKLRRLKKDEGIELVADDQEKDAEFKGRHVDKQAKIYNIDLDHSSKVLSMQEDDTEVQ